MHYRHLFRILIGTGAFLVCTDAGAQLDSTFHPHPDYRSLQTDSPEEDWETLAEELLEEGDIRYYEEWWQRLEEIRKSPMDLNTVPFDSLNMLGLLTTGQIENILAYRKENGGFRSMNELLLVKGIGLRQLAALKPLLYADPDKSGRGPFPRTKDKHEMLLKMYGRIPQNRGFHDNIYPGPPFGTNFRYKGNINRLKMSFTGESDPGEKFFTGTQRAGFDFLSGAVSYSTDRVLSRLILGDFKVEWGQGLVLWQGFSAGGNSSLAGLEKSAGGIIHYSSSGEYGFFRGAAIGLKPAGFMDIQFFASYRRLDGKTGPSDTVTGQERLMSSIYLTGLHRTENERKAKRSVEETAAGASLSFNTGIFRIQTHYLHYDRTPPQAPEKEAYKKYSDTGVRRDLFGIAWKTAIKRYYIFGEFALDDHRATAVNIGIRKSFRPLTLAAGYRRYDREYCSSHADGNGAYSNTSNEEGFNAAIELAPVQGLLIRGTADYYRFFTARYRALCPDNGAKARLEILYRHGKIQQNFTASYKFRPEEKARNVPSHRKNTDLRYQIAAEISRQIELRGRVQYTLSQKEGRKENGTMLSADLIYSSPGGRFKTQNRLAWFNTASYYSRIYLYENNVLYGYSTPAFQGRGLRIYTNLSCKAGKHLTFYAKAGLTARPGTGSWGSGAETTSGPVRADITGQIRYTF